MNSEVKIPAWPPWMLAAHLMHGVHGVLPGGGIGLASLLYPAGLVDRQTNGRVQFAGLLFIDDRTHDTTIH